MLKGWTMLAEPCPISGYPLIRKNGVVYSVAMDMEVKRATPSKNDDVEKEPSKGKTTETHPRMVLYEKRVSELERKGWNQVEGTLMMMDPKGHKFDLETGNYVTKEQSDTSWIQNLTSGRLRKKLQDNNNNSALQQTKKKIPEKTKTDSEISREIGVLLLKGYRMLDKVCPYTNACPLMRDRDGREFSVAIGKYLDEVEEEEEEETSTKIQDPVPISNTTSHTTLTDQDDKTEENARKCGELMLKGWKMLATTCPVTGTVPLMQNKEGRKYSVAIGKFMDELYNDDDEEEEENSKEEEKSTATIKTNISHNTDRKNMKNAQNKIGELLMKGWTMLAETCPITNVPLMQNREGRKYSCGLGRFMDEVEEDQVVKETEVKMVPQQKTCSSVSYKTKNTTSSNRAVQALLDKVDRLRVQLEQCSDPVLVGEIADAMLKCSQSAKGIMSLDI